MDNIIIIFYSESKSDNPWMQNTPEDTKNVFNSAVLNLLIYINSNFVLKTISLESFY
ncbi:hypothetical protein JCM31447_00840 [Fluviispira sanaruensis]|uniref:Uncharacterized protein n=1 Tax=Fluviispira sanaruensis TaxID=2493639 RepID=A0A4V0P217_FLUSA|nr:hypothetical protein JCM31447_00840 [Fluviispira sanaruensis]